MNERHELFVCIFHPNLVKQYGGYISHYGPGGVLKKNETLFIEFEREVNRCGIEKYLGFINGNEHNVKTLTINRFDADFILPGDNSGSLDMNRKIIPLSLFDRYLKEWSNSTLATYHSISQISSLKESYYFDPPPPIQNPDRVIPYNEGFRDDASKYGVNPGAIRLKVYSRYISMLRTV